MEASGDFGVPDAEIEVEVVRAIARDRRLSGLRICGEGGGRKVESGRCYERREAEFPKHP